MQKKIILITGDSYRHRALSIINYISCRENLVLTIFESNPDLKKHIHQNTNNNAILDHIKKRDQIEEEYFGWCKNFDLEKFPCLNKPKGWSSSEDCIELIKNLKPDLIIVYGSSILKGKIINTYKNKIINLHLGLSPYYRGSGTNYFPFVNNELEYFGATYLLLDAGVDTGKIIHQIRPKIITSDYYHISYQFLIQAFYEFIKIIENFDSLDLNIKQPKIKKDQIPKLYKRVDFNDDSVNMLKKNLSNGIVENYLENKIIRDSKVQISQQNL